MDTIAQLETDVNAHKQALETRGDNVALRETLRNALVIKQEDLATELRNKCNRTAFAKC